MAARQLLLFDPPRPLPSRLGADFFREIPSRPGVYLMCGGTERVLYVGKAKNLRRRLASYRIAHPERLSRKIFRLLHQVERIVWDECPNEESALRRESQLLRVLRPRFNTANVYPQAARFVGWSVLNGGLDIGLTPQSNDFDRIYGAFKAHTSQSCGSLLRLLWSVIHQPTSPHEFPARLLSGRAPQLHRFNAAEFARMGPKLPELLDHFLSGCSSLLVDWLRNRLPTLDRSSRFQQTLFNADLERLQGFYERGPKRNQELRQIFGLNGEIIAPEELNDLLAVHRKARRSKP